MKAIIPVSAECVAKWQIPHANLKTGAANPTWVVDVAVTEDVVVTVDAVVTVKVVVWQTHGMT